MKIEKVIYRLNDRSVEIIIERKKIKHTYIRVREGLIRVSTPTSTPLPAILKLIDENAMVLLNRLEIDEVKAHAKKNYTYLGYRVEVQPILDKKSYIKWEAPILEVHHRKGESVDELIDLFYGDEAKKVLPTRFISCYERFRKHYPIPRPELSLRRMKSRLGSCYYRKNRVILNVYNVRYREEIIDFIIFHELCHFIHPNHSPSFYRCLAQFVPNHQNLRKEINHP